MTQKITLLLFLGLGLGFASCKSSSPTSSNTNNNSNTATKISGRISLAVSVDGLGANPTPGVTETKSEQAQANLVFDLPETAITGLNGNQAATWQNPTFGGSVHWLEHDELIFDCNGGKGMTEDTVIKTFNSASAGAQPGGVQIVIQSSGQYGISVTGAWKGYPSHQVHTTWSNCQAVSYAADSADVPGVYFEQYFSPFFGGAMGSFTGQVGSDPNHISGVWDGTDQMTIYNVGSTTVTVPVKVTVTWDLTKQ